MPTPTPGLWKCANGEIVEIGYRSAILVAYPWVGVSERYGMTTWSDSGRSFIHTDLNLVEPHREPAKISRVLYGYRDINGQFFASMSSAIPEQSGNILHPLGSARVEIVEGVFAEPETKGA